MGAEVSSTSPGLSSVKFQSRLLRAVFRNDAEMVNYLISQGDDLNVVEHGHAALNVALYTHNKPIAKLLLEAGISVNNAGVTMPVLIQCAVLGHTVEVELLLQYGADINQHSKEGSTVLHYLAQEPGPAQLNLIMKLLRKGGDLAAVNHDGHCVLHILASKQDSAFMSRFLAIPSTNFNQTNRQQCTPLHVALKERHYVTATALVACGADINISDRNGITPLITAVAQGFPGAVKLLLNHGAQPKQTARNGMSALHCAAHTGSIAVLTMLLQDEDVDINCVDGQGLTPLHSAAHQGHLSSMELLLEHGAELMCLNNQIQTPLHLASQAGVKALDCATFLIEHGCPRDLPDADQVTPVHYAASSGNVALLRSLLHRGNRNLQDGAGRTLLLRAVCGGDLDTVQLLLAVGCLVDLADSSGHTPLFKAMTQYRIQLRLVESLLQNDADSLNTAEVFAAMLLNNVITEDVLHERHSWIVEWLSREQSCPSSLRHLCRCAIQQCLGVQAHLNIRSIIEEADLDIPQPLIEYLSNCMIPLENIIRQRIT